LIVIVRRTTVTTAHGGSAATAVDDLRSLDTDYQPHYQVYRGMSPNSANRLEVRQSLQFSCWLVLA